MAVESIIFCIDNSKESKSEAMRYKEIRDGLKFVVTSKLKESNKNTFTVVPLSQVHSETKVFKKQNDVLASFDKLPEGNKDNFIRSIEKSVMVAIHNIKKSQRKKIIALVASHIKIDEMDFEQFKQISQTVEEPMSIDIYFFGRIILQRNVEMVKLLQTVLNPSNLTFRVLCVPRDKKISEAIDVSKEDYVFFNDSNNEIELPKESKDDQNKITRKRPSSQSPEARNKPAPKKTELDRSESDITTEFDAKLLNFIRSDDKGRARAVLDMDVIKKKDAFGSLLHYAAKEGANDIIDILLEMGADVNSKGADGVTPVMLAVEFGRVCCLEKLLKAGANMTITNDNNKNAVFIAFSRPDRNIQIQKIIINESKKVYKIEYVDLAVLAGCSLLEAVKLNEVKIVKALLDMGADTNKLINQQNPLLHAVANEHLDIVRVLLEYKANVNYVDAATGLTALCFAVQRSNAELVQILLDAGANPTNLNTAGNSALSMAFKTWHVPLDIQKSIVIHVKKTSPLNQIFVDFIYSAGCSLHQAVELNEPSVVEALLERGANINQVENGKTSLISAVKNQYLDVVKVLVKFNPNQQLTDATGNTAFSWALRHHNVDLVKLLLNHGANPNGYVTLEGRQVIPPLLYLTRRSDVPEKTSQCFEELLKGGANLSTQSLHLLQLLNVAIDAKRSNIIKQVISHATLKSMFDTAELTRYINEKNLHEFEQCRQKYIDCQNLLKSKVFQDTTLRDLIIDYSLRKLVGFLRLPDFRQDLHQFSAENLNDWLYLTHVLEERIEKANEILELENRATTPL